MRPPVLVTVITTATDRERGIEREERERGEREREEGYERELLIY